MKTLLKNSSKKLHYISHHYFIGCVQHKTIHTQVKQSIYLFELTILHLDQLH